jgi:hypothetical protein
MSSDLAPAGTGGTELERVMHYREQAAQFRGWAADETTKELRDGLFDLARQYERLASELEARRRNPQALL